MYMTHKVWNSLSWKLNFATHCFTRADCGVIFVMKNCVTTGSLEKSKVKLSDFQNK